MNARDREHYDIILAHLGDMIRDALTDASSEQSHPSGDSDRSDTTIKDALEHVKCLRTMRDNFETLITGAIL